MAGVKRIKRFASLAEEVVAVFKEAMESKRVVHGDVLETIEDIFMAIDQDGGGTVSVQEFKVGLNRLSIILTPRSLDELVNSIDTDGDGEINFAEFVAYMNQKFAQRSFARICRTHNHDHWTPGTLPSNFRFRRFVFFAIRSTHL